MGDVPLTIAARSRLEAMDLSLVLISQGIESTIQRGPEGTGWMLEVPDVEHARALESIRLYRTENRRWGLRREAFHPGLVFDWVSLIWVVLVSMFFWINATRTDLENAGILDTTAIAHGQWWRLFTAIWLHADDAHLASNAGFGFVLLGLAMGRYGTGPGLLGSYLAGAVGNVLSSLFSLHGHYGLGASGMVMGALGLLAVQSLSLWRASLPANRQFLIGLAAGLLLFLLVGLAPGTDIVAHAGGFAAGVAIGLLMSPFVRRLHHALPNAACGLAFLVLVLWPWWLALHHSS